MPRSGGVYSPTSGIPVSTTTIASSTVFNTLVDDLGDEITNSVPRDGTAAPTADLPMGSQKHTNVGNAAARNQYAAAGQIQDGTLVILGSVAGTNTITAALSPAITAYVNGLRIGFKPANNNTGAATIAINGLSAVSIVKAGGAALTANDLIAGVFSELIYDGSSFYLITSAQTEGTYSGSLTGMTGAVVPTIRWVRQGNRVTLHFDAISGTSNSTSMNEEAGNMPAAIRPTRNVICQCILHNSGANVAGIASLSGGSSLITFGVGATSGNFTSSGAKGFANGTITYLLI